MLPKYLAGHRVSLIHLFKRRQGLIIPAGNPKQVRSIADMTRPDVLMVNRQEGSGTRVLFDALLEKEGISPDGIRGFDNAVNTHYELALLVHRGDADVGIGIESAARTLGLDFVPIMEENYDIALLQEYLNMRQVRMALDYMATGNFRKKVETLAGYDMTDCCTPVWEGRVTV